MTFNEISPQPGGQAPALRIMVNNYFFLLYFLVSGEQGKHSGPSFMEFL